ncbi:TonB-dependent receptor [Candidatus Poribacteria bacterium]|nr:TonB-dependent receptor [Candidatus Poribacteria bacterium]
MWLTVRGFANIINDAIVENVVSEKPSQSQSVNAGKTTAYGGEVSVNHKLSDVIEWFANYTYTTTEIQNDVDPDQDGANVPFVPENTINIGTTLNLPLDFRVITYLHIAGEIYDSTSKSGRNKFDSYELLNLKLQKTLIKRNTKQVDFYASFYNVTNNKFKMPWQFQDPGFSASGGIKAGF